jgi:hypothetical protein
MAATAEKVNFPFSLALPAARSLWQLAQSILNDVEPARQRAAATGVQEFRGTYAQQFVSRMRTSASNARTVAQDLEQAALNIAQAWADAQHQQQLYCYYAMVKEQRDNQSVLQDIGNWISGDHTNYGSPPAAPQVPAPPYFNETSVPQAHVPGAAPAVVG